MPWVETEELFTSTLKAAIDAASPHDDTPKDMQVVDLGEAGRQEVWRSGSRTIQKTIAKHGGECFPSGYALRQTCRNFNVAQKSDWTSATLRMSISKPQTYFETLKSAVSLLQSQPPRSTRH
jgi:hypothetical protein